jgi:hypothetical protein
MIRASSGDGVLAAAGDAAGAAAAQAVPAATIATNIHADQRRIMQTPVLQGFHTAGLSHF